MLSIDAKEQADLVRKLSILFVDDDPDVRESMTQYLSRRVDKVHSAQNGIAGLDSFRELHPDLVISDIRMGGMDGLTMCREIREVEPGLPVIIISAHNESEILLSSIDLGITKFMVKPVDTGKLMDAISSVARELEQQRNLQSRLQQNESNKIETDYDNECVRNYVSHFLEENQHEEISCVRHLNIPKLEVSGDFYSVARHEDDLYVMLADGAGHGLSAVIPALHIPGIFKQQAQRGFSLLTIAAEINRTLHEQHIFEHFVATTLMRINPHEKFIEVLNCSNPPVFIFNEAGDLLNACHSKSTALGMVSDEGFSVEVEHFEMDQNARIYLFTDGLVDTLHASFPNFGYDELRAMLGNIRSPDVFDEVAGKLQEAAMRCKEDDVTMLEIHFDLEAAMQDRKASRSQSSLFGNSEIPVALNQMTLLYVEDEELAREYLSLYLNRRFGMVYVAKDGKEGLELFRKHRPQIVLSDIKMPQMDGLEMADEIRKLDKNVPIVVTSGFGSAKDTERMFEMGISRFHMKPMDPGKLTETIKTCLGQANVLNSIRLSASAFQASSLAVITADQDKRIVAVNPSFTRITGYELAEVFGQNPTLLSSGKHDASHYQAMWRALAEFGSWSGELMCQHKNGATVSEWLTVNVVKGADGALSGYHFIFSDISERQMNEERVRKLMLHDTLTSLPNRMMFADRINEMLLQAGLRRGCLALVYFNIDRFFEINNTHGVHVGDDVLFVVAQRLLASVGTKDVVSRMGGDEFAVLMLQDEGRESFEREVIELSRVISQPIEVDGSKIQLRLSIGIGLYPSDGETYEELVKSACSAMNHAQLAGGNTYRFFDKSVGQREDRQVILRQGISSSLQNNEFFMLYQPKYSLSQQKVVGAEALVRWNHPTYGLISPVEFIPIAERSGAVIEMSEWIIDTVCAQQAQWRKQGWKLVPVSINISPMHFWRGDLVGSLQKGLQKWDVSTSVLQIEVTENVVMNTSERTLQVLGQLKDLGFKLSIDDFGTGYSSLRYLKDLPVSELKIDRSFIIEIPEAAEAADDLSRTAIPRAIIRLANEFKLAVVAEGVETERQKNFLVENGCDVIQGYLFSPPIPENEFAAMLS
ncbi:MAG: EAL domain-containing protein [Gammaproteobacteria bacterium]|nr:EAL domain-containing protein [Gammaproteobacteria bacterium]MBU1481372.1 EAL domain-containing protein [Gammaproteobacteria bacterium]